MGDQQKWFKFWCSAPSDDDIQALPPETRWAWAAFGTYTKLHGTNGVIKVRRTNHVLAAQMGVATADLIKTIALLPHVYAGTAPVNFPHGNKKLPVCAGEFVRCGSVESGGVARGGRYPLEEWCARNGEIIVTWCNWQKYQGDSTVADRQKKFRERNRNGVRGEENKNKNKKRRDESNSPKGSHLQTLVDSIWDAWPKPRQKNKGDVEKSLKRINPSPELLAGMLAKIEALKKSAGWKKDNYQYVPYPASWLNAKGWEDEVEDFLGVTSRKMLPDL